MRTRRTAVLVWAAAALASTPAAAHHEAIFGPQSAVVFSAERYASAQVFTRRTGQPGERTEETTAVVGGGLPIGRSPMSVSVVLPFSAIASGGTTRAGVENAVITARYRLDTTFIDRALAGDSYVLGVGGIEVPTGTIDYAFGKGAPALVSGAVFGVERRPFSALAYGVVHHYFERAGVRDSGNTFVGAGVAWTPIDNEPEGRLLSLQLGLSQERTLSQRVGGALQPDTGGWTVMLHPAVVWAAGTRTLLFVSTALPLADRWRNPADRESMRVGTGTIINLGD